MGLRDKLKRLRRVAEEGAVLIRQRDGSVRAFDNMHVLKEMFLTKTDLFSGRCRESEVLEAVRNATPDSRAPFEERYGEITMTAHIIAAPDDGGWIERYEMLEDGTVERTVFEFGTEENERIREEVRQRGPAF